MDKCGHGHIEKYCVTCYSISMKKQFPDIDIAWND